MRTYMLVSEIDVNISPAIPITSSPVDNWFRNRGCPKIKIYAHLMLSTARMYIIHTA